MSAIVLLVTQDRVLATRLIRSAPESDENPLTILGVDGLSEAMQTLELNDSVDAIIVDWDFLTTRNSDLLQALQNTAPQLPVIVLGGNPTRQQYMQLVENGAQDYLPKRSLDGETLARVVHSAIARKYRELMLFADQRRAQVIFSRHALERVQARTAVGVGAPAAIAEASLLQFTGAGHP